VGLWLDLAGALVVAATAAAALAGGEAVTPARSPRPGTPVGHPTRSVGGIPNDEPLSPRARRKV